MFGELQIVVKKKIPANSVISDSSTSKILHTVRFSKKGDVKNRDYSQIRVLVWRKKGRNENISKKVNKPENN